MRESFPRGCCHSLVSGSIFGIYSFVTVESIDFIHSAYRQLAGVLRHYLPPALWDPFGRRGIVIKTNTSCMTLMACSNFHTFSFGISQFFLRSRFVAALLVLCMLTGESAGPESFWIYQVLGRLSLKCIF